MVSYEHYVAGWLDSSIHDFLEAFPPPLGSMKYALITCLDSNLKPGSLLNESPELRSLASEARSLRGGVLLPTKVLLEANARCQLFLGFDEIWFFPDEIHKPKPNSA